MIFLSSKSSKGFSNINDSVKSSLQKWIISHPHAINYNIGNNYITFKFDDRVRGVKTELCQKFLLQLSVRELHIDMKKKATGFSMSYNEKGLVHIRDSAL